MRIPAVLVLAALCMALGREAAAQAGGPAPGQAAGDLAGGYGWLREQGPSGAEADTYPTGWIGSGAVRLVGGVSAVGEVGGNYRTNVADESAHVHAFFGGVRFRIMSGARTAAFVQALAGTERFAEPGLEQSGFAMQFGGGLDFKLKGRLGARTQFDYRIADQDGSTFKATRLGFGAVWWFGR